MNAPAAAAVPPWATTLLAAVAGWVDTLGFIALYGLFTAHVTGNFVLIGKELAQHGGDVLPKLLAFPAFIAGVAVSSLIASALKSRGRAALGPLLVTQAVLLAGFMLAGLRAEPIDAAQASSALALAAGCLGACAMGVQNAQARLVLGGTTPTTVMTGNVTQFVLDAIDSWRAPRDERAAARTRLRRLLWPIFGFALGATAAAFAFGAVSFKALIPPIAALLALAFVTRPART